MPWLKIEFESPTLLVEITEEDAVAFARGELDAVDIADWQITDMYHEHSAELLDDYQISEAEMEGASVWRL